MIHPAYRPLRGACTVRTIALVEAGGCWRRQEAGKVADRVGAPWPRTQLVALRGAR